MQWSEVLNDPSLKNLPYKIELNEYGQIVMSPASNKHGFLQAEIAFFLRNNRQGKVLIECSIETSKSVKVADVAWGTTDFFQRNGIDTLIVKRPKSAWKLLLHLITNRKLWKKSAFILIKERERFGFAVKMAK